jgi:hypothetical protein
MNDPFGGGFVDDGDGGSQSLFSGGNILALYSFADFLDKSLQGRADVFVSGIFYLVLFDTLESRLMMSQTAPPKICESLTDFFRKKFYIIRGNWLSIKK